MAKKLKPIMPLDENMLLAFQEIVKANKYIVITQTEGMHEGEYGTISQIRHETDPIETLEELEYFAAVFRPRAAHQQELNDLLGDINIDPT